MSDSFEITNGPGRVRVQGLRTAQRQLAAAGASADDLKDLMQALGSIVTKAANPPEKTGRLAATIRAGRGKTKAVVRAGGARAPYAGVIHYGWPARNIRPQPFLTDALAANRSRIFQELDAGIGELLKKYDLN